MIFSVPFLYSTRVMDRKLVGILVYLVILHFALINPSEKLFAQYIFGPSKRPNHECVDNTSLACQGMPSGHAEVIAFVMIMLYFANVLNAQISILLVILIGLQRIIFRRHTISQVVVGVAIGCVYGAMYNYLYTSTRISILIVTPLIISLLYSIIVTLKIIHDMKHDQTPHWVDKRLEDIIYKKTTVSFLTKLGHTLTSLLLHNRSLYCSWTEFENKIDKMINMLDMDKIDVIVGIKSGGAFMANCLGVKTGKPYVYVKFARKCNKITLDSVVDMVDKHVVNFSNYQMCEPITYDLRGKRVLLLDEVIDSGKTIISTKEYIINDKKAKNVTVACFNSSEKGKLRVGDVLISQHYAYNIYPWGYNN